MWPAVGGAQVVLSIFGSHPLPCLLRQSLYRNQSFLLARLAGQQALGIHLSPSPQIWITRVIAIHKSMSTQGSERRSSCLYGRCFTNPTTFLAPTPFLRQNFTVLPRWA